MYRALWLDYARRLLRGPSCRTAWDPGVKSGTPRDPDVYIGPAVRRSVHQGAVEYLPAAPR